MTAKPDWADEIAAAAFSPEAILQWPKAGWCKSCNQPVGAWMIDLTKAQADYVIALRSAHAKGMREAAEIAYRCYGDKYDVGNTLRARADAIEKGE